MQVNDNNKNRGTHGVSSFMLDTLVSSSENPQRFSRGDCQPALEFWNAIKGKIRQLISELTQNCLRIDRYDVSTAPSNGKIGVKQPFGTEIFIPYNKSAENAQVGDTVYVIWWHTMSNAKAWKFDDSSSETFIAPTPYGGRCTVTNGGYIVKGKEVHVQCTISIVSGSGSNTYVTYLSNLPLPNGGLAALTVSRGYESGVGAYNAFVYTSGITGYIGLRVHDLDTPIPAGATFVISGTYWTE